MSSARTQARELALQVLYACDMDEKQPSQTGELLLLAAPKAPDEVRAFAIELIQSIQHVRELLDETIREALKGWEENRLHPIEHNILRIGVFELTYRPDVPASVILTESIHLAQRFGDDNAWKLINGVLDHIGKPRLDAETEARQERKSRKPAEA